MFNASTFVFRVSYFRSCVKVSTCFTGEEKEKKVAGNWSV